MAVLNTEREYEQNRDKYNVEEETLSESLEKVMGDRHFTYRGCRIREMIGGFEYNNKAYPNYIELDKAIDETFLSIANSIKKGATEATP